MANYIQTEITTSKSKQAELVHFIDTPGLVDGDMKYPFDVNEAILWTANMVDLILVFFDPIGQALCKRTLDVVEALSERHHPKLRYFLSKADEAGDECDRQRVLMQIVQELCRRPSLNKTCFVNGLKFLKLLNFSSMSPKPGIFIFNPDKICQLYLSKKKRSPTTQE